MYKQKSGLCNLLLWYISSRSLALWWTFSSTSPSCSLSLPTTSLFLPLLPRPYWRCYYSNTDAVIYVVDSSDRDRMGISKSELVAMLEVSVLILNYNLNTLNHVRREAIPSQAPTIMLTAELSECLTLEMHRSGFLVPITDHWNQYLPITDHRSRCRLKHSIYCVALLPRTTRKYIYKAPQTLKKLQISYIFYFEKCPNWYIKIDWLPV